MEEIYTLKLISFIKNPQISLYKINFTIDRVKYHDKTRNKALPNEYTYS